MFTTAQICYVCMYAMMGGGLNLYPTQVKIVHKPILSFYCYFGNHILRPQRTIENRKQSENLAKTKTKTKKVIPVLVL